MDISDCCDADKTPSVTNADLQSVVNKDAAISVNTAFALPETSTTTNKSS